MKFWMEDWQYLHSTERELHDLLDDLCRIHFDLILLK